MDIENQEPVTYSFRAECEVDVDRFKEHASAFMPETEAMVIAVIPQTLEMPNGDEISIPDVNVEIRTNLSLDDIKLIMLHVPDSHVMQETLRQFAAKDNSFERDYQPSTPKLRF